MIPDVEEYDGEEPLVCTTVQARVVASAVGEARAGKRKRSKSLKATEAEESEREDVPDEGRTTVEARVFVENRAQDIHFG